MYLQDGQCFDFLILAETAYFKAISISAILKTDVLTIPYATYREYANNKLKSASSFNLMFNTLFPGF